MKKSGVRLRPALGLLILCLVGSAHGQQARSVFISVDMEGISGIAHGEMTSSAGAEYSRGRDLMMGDLNAAIEGALSAGAETILVNDSHGSMRNVRIEELHPSASLISNNSKRYGMMQGLDDSFDAVFLIGYHARAGGEGGLMAHTGSGRVAELRVNGKPVGEGGMNAFLAGSHGVPVALATGDEAFVREIRALLGDVEAVSVKRAIRRQTAELMHPQAARQAIREAARAALARVGDFSPLVPGTPATIDLRYTNPDLAEIASIIPGVDRPSQHSIRFETETYPEAYAMIRVLYRNLAE